MMAAANDPTPHHAYEAEFDISNKLAERISILYSDPILSDVCLLVGNKEYRTHKLILCTFSDVFQAMFTRPDWMEAHEVRIVLQETPACEEVFEQFLKFFYAGKIQIRYQNIIPIMMLADKYLVENLLELCVVYMAANIDTAAHHGQLVTWLQYTASTGHQQITQACYDCLRWNFQMVSESEDFLNLELDLIENVLKHSDLVVKDETCVLEALQRWLSDGTKDEHAERLIDLIRFPMMSSTELVKLLLQPIQLEHLRSIIVKGIGRGMSHHDYMKKEGFSYLHGRGHDQDGEEGRLQFTPRLYTAERWCSETTIDNYSTLPSYTVNTLMFSSQTSFSDSDTSNDWVIELYAKGVCLRRGFLILCEGDRSALMEVPENIVKSVRFRLTCRNPPDKGIRVRIGLLMSGEHEGREHILGVMHCTRIFVKEDNVLTLDEIVPLHKLDNFMVGPNKDTLKIKFVVIPDSEMCSVNNDLMPLDTWILKDCLVVKV